MSDIVLIPTYNERDNVSFMVDHIRTYSKDIFIMFIDDNSPDGTADEVERVMRSDDKVTLFRREKKDGLGRAYVSALRKVILMSDIEHVITMDGDGSHDPSYILTMLEKAKSFDLVIGSRYVRGGGVENWAWHRRMLSMCGNAYSRTILRTKIRDLTAGFMCFNRHVLDSLDFDAFDSSGYAYLMEFKYYCVRADFSYLEIPIIFKERKVGESKISSSIITGGLVTPLRLAFRCFSKAYPC